MVLAVDRIERLYGAVQPLPGEAPSSWVIRLCAQYEWTPLSMAKFLGWMDGFSELDFTRYHPRQDKLELLTSRNVSELMVAFRMGRSVLASPSFACLTMKDGKPFRQYCPICVGHDEVPYYRISWRLASTVLCERHGIFLRSSCPRCGNSLSLNCTTKVMPRPAIKKRFLTFCSVCSRPLGLEGAAPVDERIRARLLGFQSTVNMVISSGFYRHPRYGAISAKKFLDIYLSKPRADQFPTNGPGSTGRLTDGYVYTGVNWRFVAGELLEEFHKYRRLSEILSERE